MTRITAWDDPQMDIRLRALWDEGVSTPEIGRRLGVSKNSAISRAHRIGLTKRQSPLLHGPKKYYTWPRPLPVKHRRALENTLPALQSVVRAFSVPPPKVKREPPQPKAAPTGAVTPCCWPVNDSRPWRFCEDASVPGRRYCREHDKLAFVRVREEVAA